MRKIVSMLLVAVLCMVMLAGCGGVNKEEHPLAVYEKNKIVAEIGMTKEQIKKVFGNGNERTDFLWEYDGISFSFEENKVMTMGWTNKKYSDYRGISTGTSGTQKFIYFDKNLNIVPIEDVQNTTYQDRKNKVEYFIIYYYDDEGKITTISIADYSSYVEGNI